MGIGGVSRLGISGMGISRGEGGGRLGVMAGIFGWSVWLSFAISAGMLLLWEIGNLWEVRAGELGWGVALQRTGGTIAGEVGAHQGSSGSGGGGGICCFGIGFFIAILDLKTSYNAVGTLNEFVRLGDSFN